MPKATGRESKKFHATPRLKKPTPIHPRHLQKYIRFSGDRLKNEAAERGVSTGALLRQPEFFRQTAEHWAQLSNTGKEKYNANDQRCAKLAASMTRGLDLFTEFDRRKKTGAFSFKPESKHKKRSRIKPKRGVLGGIVVETRNSFNYFIQDYWKKRKGDKIARGESFKITADAWRQLSEEEKALYQKKAQEDHKRYKREKNLLVQGKLIVYDSDSD